MDLSIVFLGTAAAAPTARRNVSGLILRRGGDSLLIDCGEGTQRQMIKSIGLTDLEHIFLTHFHADHVLGLPGMLKSFGLRGREAPLHIYGPPGLNRLIETFEPLIGRLPYALRINECQAAVPVEFDGFQMVPFEVDHLGGRSYGWALVEDQRPGRFDEARAKQLGVPAGPLFGKLQDGESVTLDGGKTINPDQVLGPARKSRKVVVSGDTAPCDSLRLAAYDADVLIHEASFGADEVTRADETRHSTATQAAETALAAEVKLLCLTHVSNRYLGKELRDQAREIFANTELARDFDIVEVPFTERGEPTLVRD